jgi:hypothetical protein
MLLIIIVFTGLNAADLNLTRLMLPEKPFFTVSLTYEHGLVLRGPAKQYCLPALPVAAITMEQDTLVLNLGEMRLKLPRFLVWGNLISLRRFLMLTN